MREYQIFYRNGDYKTVECESRKDLVSQYFNNDESLFQNQVMRILCSVQTSHYVEDISTKKMAVEIGCADVNPYGWRR